MLNTHLLDLVQFLLDLIHKIGWSFAASGASARDQIADERAHT
jgi:hypothetical protein